MKSKGLKMLIGLMTIGLMIAIPSLTQATPGANVLITDNPNHQVIEVDPLTGNVVWEYGGTGTLNYPNEAIPLTNGNILIADTYNRRVIEVTSDTKQIVWSYYLGSVSLPVDIKKCIDYTTGTPRDTLLIVDGNQWNSRVIEITYPGGVVVWELSAISIGRAGDYLFWEAKKRPGAGTPTYLITSRNSPSMGNGTVIEVQRTGETSGTIIWTYSDLDDPRDAEWTPCDNVLITNTDYGNVIEVQRDGTIAWQWRHPDALGHPPQAPPGKWKPFESTRIENGNTLVVGAWYGNFEGVDDNKDGKYRPSRQTEVYEVTPVGSITWQYSGPLYVIVGPNNFVDVEEKGIINIAKIMYEDMARRRMPLVFAGVVVPIYQPEIIWVGTPTIIATKTVYPTGPQQPGATLTYTIVLTNIGVGTATNVVVTDRVPEETDYVLYSCNPSATGGFSHDGGQTYDTSETLPVTHIRWDIGELAPGEERTIQFSVVIR